MTFANSTKGDIVMADMVMGDIIKGLADRPGADMMSRLLLALTALYVERATHTPQEQQQYLELALRLTGKVDAATRATVASILRRHPDAPPEIFDRLEGPPPQSAAVDRGAAQKAAGAAAITSQIVSLPAARAEATAAPAGAPSPSELGEAFFAATATARRDLLSRLAADVEKHDRSAADAAPEPEDNARRFDRLDAAAMQGRIGEFIREFERLFAVPKSLCERILNDRSGEPMVIVAKAAGMPISVLQRILLLVNPAVSHSVQRVYDLTDLYHGLDRGVAQKLIALWRVEAKPNGQAAAASAEAGERKSTGLRDMSVAGLRSRFGALTERIAGQGSAGGQGVSARPGPGNAARRDLRSR